MTRRPASSPSASAARSSGLAGACPIVGSYGARDRANRGTAGRLDQALEALGVDHGVKEYPGPGHSFLNDLSLPSPVRTPAIFVVMGKFNGPSGLHEPSAADARQRAVLERQGADLGGGQNRLDDLAITPRFVALAEPSALLRSGRKGTRRHGGRPRRGGQRSA